MKNVKNQTGHASCRQRWYSRVVKSTLPILTMFCMQHSIAENVITWESLGNGVGENGRPIYTQRFTITPDGPFDAVAFCMFKRIMSPTDSSDVLTEILPGYYMIESAKFPKATAGEPISIDVVTNGSLGTFSSTPDGMHLVKDGKAVKATNVIKPITSFPAQWRNPINGQDRMVYGAEAYAINDSLRSSYRAKPYGQIPTPKSIILRNEKVSIKPIKVHKIEDSRHDYYKAVITPDSVSLYTNSRYPGAMTAMLQRRMTESADANGNVPTATIEDWADYDYRGFMYDVARNFLPKEATKKVLDIMGKYGLNILHFHLGDDEGWRVEIPSLPELTDVGSRRGFTLTDDVPFLKGIYSGDGNPDSPTTANGYYTTADYIEILQYADSLGIAIIPEFDTPGHSRAAIRAMEWRYKQTGDESLRLVHDGDTSTYTTAQDLHDNIMNPALEGPYKFWGIVFDDLIDVYNKAGVPLLAVNIGGDEVPEHAWDGSEPAVALMKEQGMTDQRELHAYFVEKVAKEAAERGIKIAGWQEIALNHSPEYDKAVQPVVYGVNSWTNAGSQGRDMALRGYPIIMSNVDYLYVDQTSTPHPEEPGMTWGGLVSEFSPLHATADILVPGDSTVQSHVVGLSAQLFSETVRDLPMVERYMLPRLMGVAERGHNASPTLTDNEYFGLITEEIPRWVAEGTNFYVRQPGITTQNGKTVMNDAYGFGEIRYTLDGSEPTRESALYEGPIDTKEAKEVRAKLFIGPASSSTTILYAD